MAALVAGALALCASLVLESIARVVAVASIVTLMLLVMQSSEFPPGYSPLGMNGLMRPLPAIVLAASVVTLIAPKFIARVKRDKSGESLGPLVALQLVAVAVLLCTCCMAHSTNADGVVQHGGTDGVRFVPAFVSSTGSVYLPFLVALVFGATIPGATQSRWLHASWGLALLVLVGLGVGMLYQAWITEEPRLPVLVQAQVR